MFIVIYDVLYTRTQKYNVRFKEEEGVWIEK